MISHQERYAWIQLALTPYIGAESFLTLIQHYGSATEALRAPSSVIAQLAYMGKKAAASWHDTSKAQAATEAALLWEQQPNCRLMLLCDDDYPMLLTEGLTAPPILFVRGQVDLLHKPAVGIVGSRHATPQAIRIAKDFGKAISQHNITVISGMATGIDTAAHEGALMHSGSTIAVWGTGIDRIYPPHNEPLARQIAERGAIVSEFPLGTRPVAGNFPRRNRIIAALSRATLVVEAALESGSLITARQASEMGREVMAVPSTIDNPHAKGCHKLIKEGAKLVECFADIVNECPILLEPHTPKSPDLPTILSTALSTRCQKTTLTEITPKTQPEIPLFTPPLDNIVDKNVDSFVDNSVDKHLIPILEKIGYQATHPDFIADTLNMATDEVYAALLELEMLGAIAPLSGGRYQRVK